MLTADLHSGLWWYLWTVSSFIWSICVSFWFILFSSSEIGGGILAKVFLQDSSVLCSAESGVKHCLQFDFCTSEK